MTDEDMFDHMDYILGEKSSMSEVHAKYPEISQRNLGIVDSEPSHPLWKLIDQWGGQLYLNADQLELWEGEL